jgi:hypothetical protein
MESKLALRLCFAAVFIASVAACGGGGGGGGSMPGTTSGGGAPALSTQAKEQSVAGSALAVTGNSMDEDQFGGSGSAMTFALQRAFASRNGSEQTSPAPSSSPSCQNGVEYTQTSTGSNSFTVTVEFFYDSGCTQPRKLVTLNVSFSSSGGSANGTEELWDSSGNVVDYKTDSATFTFQSNSYQLASITVQRTVAAQPSATPFAEKGFTCLFGTGNPVDCGNGLVATINSQFGPHIYATMTPAPGSSAMPSASASPTASPTPYEIGFTGTVTGTQVSPSPSASPSGGQGWGWNPQGAQLQLSIAGTGYMGATQSMTIASGTAPAWSITGGTQIATLTGTANLGFGPSGMFSNVNVTLNDTADGLTITLTSSQGRELTGSVTNSSGQTVATVSVDVNGDGVIDYTTGATAQIRDWVILSS